MNQEKERLFLAPYFSGEAAAVVEQATNGIDTTRVRRAGASIAALFSTIILSLRNMCVLTLYIYYTLSVVYIVVKLAL